MENVFSHPAPTSSHTSCRSLDFISLMAYDFYGSWGKTTGHHSPLFKRQEESGKDAELNVVSGQWGEAGIPCPAGPVQWPHLSPKSLTEKKNRKTK